MEEIPIRKRSDEEEAVRAVLCAAEETGMDKIRAMSLATAVVELVTNALIHAGGGTVTVRRIRDERCEGVEVTVADRGPGIEDVALALQDGHSTAGGLGVGLGGVRRMVDHFEVRTRKGGGTLITIRQCAEKRDGITG